MLGAGSDRDGSARTWLNEQTLEQRLNRYTSLPARAVPDADIDTRPPATGSAQGSLGPAHVGLPQRGRWLRRLAAKRRDKNEVVRVA